MAEISAGAVKELRDRTGAGMMECKKALAEAGGDPERAVTLLRERGLARAARREGRATAEGAIAASVGDTAGALVELACETDFVARTHEFQGVARELAAAVAADAAAASPEGVAHARIGHERGEDLLRAAAGRLGENLVVKRVARLEAPSPDGTVAAYVHAGGKLGVLVSLRALGHGERIETLGRDLAMHIAAADPSPVSIDRGGVPADLVARERELFAKQAAQSGKPEKVIERIVEGRLQKFYSEVCLLEQPFVKDPDKSVQQVLDEAARELDAPVQVTGFVRFRLGEAAGA